MKSLARAPKTAPHPPLSVAASPDTIRLPAFFGDHMVIQRGKPVRFFGIASPGARLSVSWKEANKTVQSDSRGRWSATFPVAQAGGPYDFSVSDGRETLAFTDILVGDVWLCSGQSNMEMSVAACAHADSEIASADHPSIRHFKVLRNPSPTPLEDVAGQWTRCDARTVGAYTAAGYYFAKEIHDKTGVPIGLLHSSWGGTPIETWLPREVFEKSARYKEDVKFQRALEKSPARLAPEIRRRQKEWKDLCVSKDRGNRGYRQGWARSEFTDSDWSTMTVPGAWEGHGLMIDGVVWFRRTLRIPSAWAGRPLRLELGSLDDFDVTYFNGREVGRTGKSVRDAYKTARVYTIPAEMVKAGEAIVAIRIFDQFGSGGFTGSPDQMKLSCPGKPRSIALHGSWRYKIEWSVDRSVASPPMPQLPEPRAQLSYLYNGMIDALIDFPVCGVLWYQGESNAGRATTYDRLFLSLIRSWRRAWREPRLPFFFVQLANFKSVPSVPGTDQWAELREAQTLALKLPATGMAVAIDIGEATDIHPKNKQDVGLRLARLALARVYGKKVADTGPTLRKCTITKAGAHLVFDNVGKGLCTLDGEDIRGFALADKTRRWQWVPARLKGKDTVIIDNPHPNAGPAALRYAWAGNPGCNLCNSHRLPAPPFRTDRWPRVTEGHTWPF